MCVCVSVSVGVCARARARACVCVFVYVSVCVCVTVMNSIKTINNHKQCTVIQVFNTSEVQVVDLQK